MVIALTVALTLAITEPVDLDRYMGKVWRYLSAEYESVDTLLSQNYPQPQAILAGNDSSILIEENGNGFVAIHEIQALIIPGESKGNVSFFDKNKKFIRFDKMGMGWRAGLSGPVRVSKPEVGAFVWRSDIQEGYDPEVRVYFGLTGNRVALLRVQDEKGRFVPNNEVEKRPLGPAPQPYTKETLAQALESADPVPKLEALAWLAGDHRLYNAKLLKFSPNKAFDKLKSAPQVQSAVKKLRSDRLPWISEAANAIRLKS